MAHISKWLKLSKDASVKARLATSYASNQKIKNVMVQQILGLDQFLKNQGKLDKIDKRYN